jgi:S1-C subfamily serine protease
MATRTAERDPANSNPVRQLAASVSPSVVRIGRRGGRGCGFVLDDGLVVTNAHNLRDRTTQVTFADGRAVQASLRGIDRDGDLVVLEVDTGDAPALAWSDDPVQLGDQVFSVVRLADGTRVTAGTVSSTDRSFRGPRGRRITGALEHTAPLGRGSSGSPLVGADGRLVGISTLRVGDGFSIALAASAEVRALVDQLRAGRSPERRMLGVAVAPPHVSHRLRRSVGLPDRDGALVRHVEADSPAHHAGLRSGDLITHAGGSEVSSADDLASALDAVPAGADLRLHVVRGADEIDLLARFDDAGGGDAGAGGAAGERGEA